MLALLITLKEEFMSISLKKVVNFQTSTKLTDLMFYECFDSIEEAILNEKKFKNRSRAGNTN